MHKGQVQERQERHNEVKPNCWENQMFEYIHFSKVVKLRNVKSRKIKKSLFYNEYDVYVWSVLSFRSERYQKYFLFKAVNQRQASHKVMSMEKRTNKVPIWGHVSWALPKWQLSSVTDKFFRASGKVVSAVITETRDLAMFSLTMTRRTKKEKNEERKGFQRRRAGPEQRRAWMVRLRREIRQKDGKL